MSVISKVMLVTNYLLLSPLTLDKRQEGIHLTLLEIFQSEPIPCQADMDRNIYFYSTVQWNEVYRHFEIFCLSGEGRHKKQNTHKLWFKTSLARSEGVQTTTCICKHPEAPYEIILARIYSLCQLMNLNI